MGRQIAPMAEQRRRAAELDALRLSRRLTTAEQVEADRLADAAYHRLWRAEHVARHGISYEHKRASAAAAALLRSRAAAKRLMATQP